MVFPIAIPMKLLLSRVLFFVLLAAQVVLLIIAGTCASPTFLGPLHLASGLVHLRHADFTPYRVNPPLIRSVAAIPAYVAELELPKYDDISDSAIQTKNELVKRFVDLHGLRFQDYIVYGRWLKKPTWQGTILSGITLGVAELAKTTSTRLQVVVVMVQNSFLEAIIAGARCIAIQAMDFESRRGKVFVLSRGIDL